MIQGRVRSIVRTECCTGKCTALYYRPRDDYSDSQEMTYPQCYHVHTFTRIHDPHVDRKTNSSFSFIVKVGTHEDDFTMMVGSRSFPPAPSMNDNDIDKMVGNDDQVVARHEDAFAVWFCCEDGQNACTTILAFRGKTKCEEG